MQLILRAWKDRNPLASRKGISLPHRVGVATAAVAAAAADRRARRRNRGSTAALSRPERSAPMAIVPLMVGPTLLMVLLLSAGFLAMIYGALELARISQNG